MLPEWHWKNQPKDVQKKAKQGISKGWGKKPKTGKWLNCPICGTRFYRKRCHLIRSKKHYCSPECHAKSKKGKIPKNLEQARKNSPIKPGKENINWNGGISEYPSEWTGELKRKVFARDNNKCQDCGKKGKKRSDLIVHHVDFNKNNCKINNLVLLCRSCHMKRHWEANIGVPGLKKRV